MIKRLQQSPQINLARDSTQPPLMVDLESFFGFSFWIAEELQDLIADHQRRERQREQNQWWNGPAESGEPSPPANSPLDTAAAPSPPPASDDPFDEPYAAWVEWE